MSILANSTTTTTAAVQGIWGPVTATLDWCEENYQFTRYIAELVNTFSNLITVWFALHSARKSVENDLPRRFLFGHLGFLLVGLGSFAFHATLLFGPQLADELPMIYVAAFTAYSIYDTAQGWDITNKRSALLIAALVAFDVLFTWSYWISRDPVYHQFVFGTILVLDGVRVTQLLRTGGRADKLGVPAETRNTILRLFWFGGGLFFLGFVIWNGDNVFCGSLTTWKSAIGWPLAFLLEGHSWWHILTAAGTYYMSQGMSYLTLIMKDDHKKFTLAYEHGLPHIARISSNTTEEKTRL